MLGRPFLSILTTARSALTSYPTTVAEMAVVLSLSRYTLIFPFDSTASEIT